MVQSLFRGDRCFPNISGVRFLTEVFKQQKAAQTKARHDSPEGARQPMGIRGYAPPENFEIVLCQRCDFMPFFGGGGGGRGSQSVTENELFMTPVYDH